MELEHVPEAELVPMVSAPHPPLLPENEQLHAPLERFIVPDKGRSGEPRGGGHAAGVGWGHIPARGPAPAKASKPESTSDPV